VLHQLQDSPVLAAGPCNVVTARKNNMDYKSSSIVVTKPLPSNGLLAGFAVLTLSKCAKMSFSLRIFAMYVCDFSMRKALEM
jgi:hypothetical protein